MTKALYLTVQGIQVFKSHLTEALFKMFILTDPQQVAPPNLLLLMWIKTTFHKEFLFFNISSNVHISTKDADQ